MRKLFAMSAAALVGVAMAAVAAEKSGLPEGERPPAYTVTDVTGPNAGKSLCYRCQFGNKPVVNVFARTVDDSLIALIKKVDKEMDKNKDLNGFVTFLSEDPKKTTEELKKLAKDNGIKKIPLTVFDGAEGPKGYKISKEADVTVLMWVNSEVKSNHAYGAGEMCNQCVSTVVADIPKILK